MKISGNFYQLPHQTHNAIIIMARGMGVEKEREDFQRLKEQRAEKMITDELDLQQHMDKASADHVELMFMNEIFVQGDCYKTVEQVE